MSRVRRTDVPRGAHATDTYDGRRAVVTGGSHGIGLAIARLLVERGAHVIVTGRSQPALDDAQAALGDSALAVRGDVSTPADLDALADRARTRFGGLDAVFVNAGTARAVPLETVAEQEYDEMNATNVRGAYFTVQKLLPLLGDGAGIVLTTSVAHLAGIRGTSVYSAGQAALRSMTRTFAAELADRGVRVNAVSPGPIATGTLETTMSAEAAAEFVAQRVAENPLQRLGTPREVAIAAAFLAFDATYTTGAELTVDGGVSQL